MKLNNRKQQIIEACIHLICQKGLDLSSMQNIANEVGISKATLYFYFDSKESLIHEVHRYCHDLDVGAANVGVDQIPNAVDKLIKRFENIIEHFIKHPKESQVEMIYSTTPSYFDGDVQYKQDFLNDIIDIIREGIEKEQIKNMPNWLLAELYYGMATSLYLKFKNNPDLWQDELIHDSCCQFIRDSFKYKK